LNYIELFAGCGGLSLGLESIEDSRMIMSNELSPMPAQTFAYNFFQEDMDIPNYVPNNVKWLSSKFNVNDLKSRLKEDPRYYPELNSKKSYSDISIGDSLDGKLVVGNIIHLNKFLENNQDIKTSLSNAYGHGELDFVSGGPPCQSFSMAGLRTRDCDKNLLPWEFAKFVEQVQPRFTILENVTGILRAFQNEGERYYAWIEVAKAFSMINYVPLCLHVNAKFAGVPQNRPRFIMIGVRLDVYHILMNTFNEAEINLFDSSFEFFQAVNNDLENIDHLLKYHDVAKEGDIELFNQSFLAPLVIEPIDHISVSEAIDDLRFDGENLPPSTYITRNAELLANGVTIPRENVSNHEERANGQLVQRRFRLYQVMQMIGQKLSKEIKSVLKGDNDSISDEAWREFKLYDYLIEDGSFVSFTNKSEFIAFLKRHPTKKQTQKALNAERPAPAALSIPDDACHYQELRTLTVREMARIQSFPDSFVFKSKVTTGGKMRQFEVPQYTQVGNAVPPLLGRALGLTIQNLLTRLE